MKHKYVKPLAEPMQAAPQTPLALSILQGTADPDAEVLVKEEGLFDFECEESTWEEE